MPQLLKGKAEECSELADKILEFIKDDSIATGIGGCVAALARLIVMSSDNEAIRNDVTQTVTRTLQWCVQGGARQ